MREFLKTVETLLKNEGAVGDTPGLGIFLRLELVEQCEYLLEWFVAEEQAALAFEVFRKHPDIGQIGLFFCSAERHTHNLVLSETKAAILQLLLEIFEWVGGHIFVTHNADTPEGISVAVYLLHYGGLKDLHILLDLGEANEFVSTGTRHASTMNSL